MGVKGIIQRLRYEGALCQEWKRDAEVCLSPVILANNDPTALLYFRMAYCKEPLSPYNLEKTHRFPLYLVMTSSDINPEIPILCLIINLIVCSH